MKSKSRELGTKARLVGRTKARLVGSKLKASRLRSISRIWKKDKESTNSRRRRREICLPYVGEGETWRCDRNDRKRDTDRETGVVLRKSRSQETESWASAVKFSFGMRVRESERETEAETHFLRAFPRKESRELESSKTQIVPV